MNRPADAGERLEGTWTLPPPETVEPLPIRTPVGFLLAPLVVLFPRTVGPHFSRATWASAFLVHVFWALVAVGLIAMYRLSYTNWHWLDLLQPTDLIWQALAADAYAVFRKLNSLNSVVQTTGIALGIEAAFLLLSVLLWPFAGVNETLRVRFARSLKLVWYSTPAICAVLIVWGGVSIERLWGDRKLLLTYAGVAYYLWVLLRLGARYGGPQEGPRWDQFEPRCDRCGYNLMGMTLQGKCAECGTTISEALSRHREPPAFAAGPWFARPVNWLRTSCSVLFNRRFAQHAAVWLRRREADRFLVWTCTALAIFIFAHLVFVQVREMPFMDIPWRSLHLENLVPQPAIIGVSTAGILFGLVWLARLGYVLLRFGREGSEQTLLCYYSVIPAAGVVLGLLGAEIGYHIVENYGPWPDYFISGLGSIDSAMFVYLLSAAPGAALALMAIPWAVRGVRAARYSSR